ncbi:MAG TPA: DUF2172 domain-containing protein [Candidatus Ozemobacteraceae bacterium]|nr:DUF2172 domain-containing protein [Candidatus Ozemobacteraceae bacterium]
MTAPQASSYTRADILQALTAAGLRSGDTVFVTTSLGMLGVPEGVASGEDLNRLFFETLRECLGERGTIIVPTYSYTFGRSTATEPQIYDPLTTPSAIGPFPEFFRRQPGVVRSLDPMMSVAGHGPATENLFRDLPKTSYGADSVFARLAHVSAKCCSIGLGPNWMPFIHHTDWLRQVPFRYDKLFHGIIRTGQHEQPTAWVYSVAMLHQASHSTGHKVAKRAVEAGVWQFAPLGRARIYVADYRRYFDFTLEQLETDPWITADGPPGDPLALERERVPEERSIIAEPETHSIDAILLQHAPRHRTDVSDASHHLLHDLAKHEGLELYSFKSGENHFDWIIPERWNLQSVSLHDTQGHPVLAEDLLRARVYGHSLSVDRQLSKSELLPHLSMSRENHSLPRYRHTITNRDWGFCLSRQEFEALPSMNLHAHIVSAYSYGLMTVACSPITTSNRPLLLLTACVSGPSGGKDLLGVSTALQAARQLRHAASSRNWECGVLLHSGPAGFAAWLDQRSDVRHRLAGIVEIRHPLSPDSLPIVVFRKSDQYGLNSHLQHLRPAAEISESDSQRPYLLTRGQNPVAQKSIPENEFPVISIGAPLACEMSAGEYPFPYASLESADFALATACGHTLAGILQGFTTR